MLKLKLQYFGHIMQRVDSLEKTLMLGGIEGRRRRGQPKMGGSWWRGLTECGPLEKGMASHFSILALRTP